MPRDHRLAARRDAARRRLSGTSRAVSAAGPHGTKIPLVERAYRHSIRAMSAILCALGIAMIAVALARGGGALALGVVLGAAFVIIGVGRLVLAGRGSAEPPR